MTLEEYKQRFGVAPGVRDRLKGVGNIIRPFAEAMSGLAYPQQSRPAAAAPQGQQPASIYSDLERLALQPDDQKFMAGTGATEQEANLAIGPMAAQPAVGPVSETVDQVLAGQGAGQMPVPQRGFQADIEEAYSRLNDVAAGGARTVLPEEQRGSFLQGHRYGGTDGVQSSEIARMRTEAGIAPDVGATPVAPGRAGAFAERRTPDGGAYVVGSEADPMRRLERQREEYQAANRERYQDIAADLRTGGAQPQMTAAQLSDKREMDRRMASINAMPEGPRKEDLLNEIQDEAKAKRDSKVTDFDRFTGSIGSPDHKAREGRMAAYQAKIKELSDSRLITKQQAGAMAQQAKKADREQEKADREQFKFDQEVLSAQQKQEDRDVESELMQRGLTEKKSIAAANSGFRSMATFNGKIGGKGPRINGAEVTDMFGQMDPAMRMDVMEEAARNVEHYEMDPRAAFMAAFTPFLKMKQRQTS